MKLLQFRNRFCFSAKVCRWGHRKSGGCPWRAAVIDCLIRRNYADCTADHYKSVNTFSRNVPFPHCKSEEGGGFMLLTFQHQVVAASYWDSARWEQPSCLMGAASVLYFNRFSLAYRNTIPPTPEEQEVSSSALLPDGRLYSSYWLCTPYNNRVCVLFCHSEPSPLICLPSVNGSSEMFIINDHLIASAWVSFLFFMWTVEWKREWRRTYYPLCHAA